jgi:hypothetical protein
MPNLLTVPNSGIISFDNRVFGNLTTPDLSASSRITYDAGGSINITSYTTAATALDRFTVDGTQGRLFSVTDVLTGTLFSVNNITGLPILEVGDSNTVIAGRFNTNAWVVSGINTGIGSLPSATDRLSVSGNSTFVGNVSATGTIITQNGTSDNWNNTTTTVRSNSANWNNAYNTSTLVQNNSASWAEPIRRFDFTTVLGTDISYSGTAPLGTPETNMIWKLIRLTYANNGSVSNSASALNSWTGRLTAAYI